MTITTLQRRRACRGEGGPSDKPLHELGHRRHSPWIPQELAAEKSDPRHPNNLVYALAAQRPSNNNPQPRSHRRSGSRERPAASLNERTTPNMSGHVCAYLQAQPSARRSHPRKTWEGHTTSQGNNPAGDGPRGLRYQQGAGHKARPAPSTIPKRPPYDLSLKVMVSRPRCRNNTARVVEHGLSAEGALSTNLLCTVRRWRLSTQPDYASHEAHPTERCIKPMIAPQAPTRPLPSEIPGGKYKLTLCPARPHHRDRSHTRNCHGTR